MSEIRSGYIIPSKLSLVMNEPDTAATGVLTSDETQVTAGKIVTIGDIVYTFVSTLAAVKATGLVDIGTTGPLDTETITIGDIEYTFVAALSTGPTVPNEILLEVDVDDTLQNLKDAINTGAVADKVSVGTVANPDVVATTLDDTEHSLVLEAAVAGEAGNSIVLTEALTDTTRTAFANGADAPGAYAVLIGADADESLTNLRSAINGTAGEGTTYSTGTEAHPDVTCGAVTAHAVTVTAIVLGLAGNLIAKAENDAHLDWDGTGGFLTGGDINDIDTMEIGESGFCTKIYVKLPVISGSATAVITIETADGVVLLTSAALNENATTAVTVGFVLAPTDIIRVDANADPSEEETIYIYLR